MPAQQGRELDKLLREDLKLHNGSPAAFGSVRFASTKRMPSKWAAFSSDSSAADVCELLKESQFVNDGVSDVQISQVVSGALDRLHQENDACVRYDSERKLWAYLHASRTVDDFLARSQQHRAALVAVAGPPKESTPPATPSAPPPQQETPESEPSPPPAPESLPSDFSHLPMAHPGRPHG